MPSTTKRSILLVLFLFAPPLYAQSADVGEGSPALADAETLRALLPEQFGAYAYDKTFVPPGFTGEDGEEMVAPNVIYADDAGTALFIVVEQHRDPNRSEHDLKSEAGSAQAREFTIEEAAALEEATDATIGGRPAFVMSDPQRIWLPVGHTLTLSAYFGGGEGEIEDLYVALEAADLEGLEALDRAYTRAYDLAAVEAYDRTTGAEVPMAALHALLPEEVDGYTLGRLSAGPFVDGDGWENEHGRTLTGEYTGGGGVSYTVALSHFERAPYRAEALPMPGRATETKVADQPAFAGADPPRVVAFVGETFAVVAETATAGVSAAELVAALEAVDLAGLVALDETYTEALEGAMGPDVAPTDAISDLEGEVDCESFSADVRASAREMTGASAFGPWVRFLSKDEASAAERENGEPVAMLSSAAVLTFPKEGNAWLQCVRENDILWAPLGPTSFLVRVEELWEMPDRAALRVEPARLPDLGATR